MKWKKLGKLTLAVIGTVVPAVGQVEAGVKALNGAKGQAKQDAVVDLVKGSAALVEQLSEKDLLNDAEVEGATRRFIDAVVSLQNVLAKKEAEKAAADR